MCMTMYIVVHVCMSGHVCMSACGQMWGCMGVREHIPRDRVLKRRVQAGPYTIPEAEVSPRWHWSCGGALILGRKGAGVAEY